MSEILQLRTRHVMCLAGFQKKWYNTEAKKVFDSVIKHIKRTPEIQVRLLNSCDSICHECKNFINAKCMKYVGATKDYKEKDNYVLALTKLEPDTIYRVEYVARRIANKMKTKEQAKYACAKCKFKTDCRFYNELK